MKTNLSPRTEAIAYRIWAAAREVEWNTSISELADALELDVNTVRGVIQVKGWTQRLRPSDRPAKTVRQEEIAEVPGFVGMAPWMDPRAHEGAGHE